MEWQSVSTIGMKRVWLQVKVSLTREQLSPTRAGSLSLSVFHFCMYIYLKGCDFYFEANISNVYKCAICLQ